MTDTSIDPATDGPDDPVNADDPAGSDNSAGSDHVGGTTPEGHDDKYNDPRARITKRGVWMGIGVVVFGIVGAAASIYARRTRLEQTTRFWGPETIEALQLAERVELIARGDSEFDPVELTATPGLGHLRRALLDERGFDWSTESPESALEYCGNRVSDSSGAPKCVQLRLTDPTAHRFEQVEIDLDLAGGWVGPSDGSRRVQATDWVQPKLRNYFATIIDVQQKRYDFRD